MIDPYIVNSSDRDAVQVGNVFINLKKLKKDFNKIARKVQVQSGGFRNFEVYQIKICQKKKQTLDEFIIEFAEYMRKIIMNMQNLYPQDKIAWGKCCYMIWLMKNYTYDKCHRDYTLQGNSANAKFLILQNTTYSLGEKLTPVPVPIIIKVQLDYRADDILVDSVNARILHKIGMNNKNIMEYISSFRAYITESSSGNYELNIGNYIKTLESQLIEPKKQLIEPKRHFAKKCLVAKAVKHRTLGTLMDNINSQHFEGDICPKLHTLAKTMILLGENYGFVHNDCHLGNILYDLNTKTFVLIDYGRVYFGLSDKSLDSYVSQFFEQEIDKLSLNPEVEYSKPNYSDHLHGIVMKNKSENSSYYISPYMFHEYDRKQQFDNEQQKYHEKVRNYFIQNMVLFDISTIVMNMLQTLAELGKLGNINNPTRYRDILGFIVRDILGNIVDHLDFEIGMTVRRDTHVRDIMIVVPTPDMIKNYRYNHNNIQSVFFLGIFIFSCFIDFLYQRLRERTAVKKHIILNRHYPIYEVNFTQLVNDTRIMYHAYQYARIPRVNELEYFIYSHKEFIEKLKLNIFGETDRRQMRGGIIPPPQPKKEPSSSQVREPPSWRISVDTEPKTSESETKWGELLKSGTMDDFIKTNLKSEDPDIQPKNPDWKCFVKKDFKNPSPVDEKLLKLVQKARA
jgi:hypothetical protein